MNPIYLLFKKVQRAEIFFKKVQFSTKVQFKVQLCPKELYKLYVYKKIVLFYKIVHINANLF